MIDLAISIGDNAVGNTVVETNHGERMAAPRWPQDSDFRLVAFRPGAKTCDAVWPSELAQDIALALKAIGRTSEVVRDKPAWFRRLQRYSEGAGSHKNWKCKSGLEDVSYTYESRYD